MRDTKLVHLQMLSQCIPPSACMFPSNGGLHCIPFLEAKLNSKENLCARISREYFKSHREADRIAVVAKDTCYQVWQPGFNPWTPHSGRKKTNACKLFPNCHTTLWHTCLQSPLPNKQKPQERVWPNARTLVQWVPLLAGGLWLTCWGSMTLIAYNVKNKPYIPIWRPNQGGE